MVVGDAGVDLLVPFPKFIDEKRTNVEYPVPSLQGGGTAANTAVALQKLGVTTDFVGTVGDDQYGHYVSQDFQNEGVGTDGLIVDPELNTVCVFAFIDETGERYLWGWPRVKQAFKEIDLNKVDMNAVRRAAWVHSSGMSLVDNTSSRHAILQILKEAYEAGVPTSFDLNLRVNAGILDEEYKQAVLEAAKYSTYLLGSGDEEFYYLGSNADWRDSAKAFATRERTVIARMGKDGSMAITPEETISELPFPVEVVDKVGAGDVFNAGFIAARLGGLPLRQCLIWGNAVSSYKVNRKGARSTPDAAELEQFFKRFHAM